MVNTSYFDCDPNKHEGINDNMFFQAWNSVQAADKIDYCLFKVKLSNVFNALERHLLI